MAWPREPGARLSTRLRRAAGVIMASHSDQATELASSTVCWIQNTLPPVRRTAAASLFTLGTISTATGT